MGTEIRMTAAKFFGRVSDTFHDVRFPRDKKGCGAKEFRELEIGLLMSARNVSRGGAQRILRERARAEKENKEGKE